MMRFWAFVLLLILPIGLLAQNGHPMNDLQNENQCSEIEWNTNINLDSCKTARFRIRSIKIEDHCLVIFVQYGGGCGYTNFSLLTDGKITESTRPSMQLFLSLEDRDTCKALLIKELKFDLSSLQGFASDNGLMITLLNNNETIKYQP